MQHIRSFFAYTGMIAIATAAGFIIFVGVTLVRGQTGQPPVGAPGGNVDPPLNVGPTMQVKSGNIGANGFYDSVRGEYLGSNKSYRLEVDSFGAKCQVYASAYSNESCVRTAASVARVTPIPKLPYSFCTDRDGCEVVFGIEDNDGVHAKGPTRLFISPQLDNKWRMMKAIDPYDGSIESNEGRDGANGAQTVVRVSSGKCRLTDEEAPNIDNAEGLGLEVSGSGTFTCFVDIRD